MEVKGTIKVTRAYFLTGVEVFSEIERLAYMARKTESKDYANTLLLEIEEISHKSWKAMAKEIGS